MALYILFSSLNLSLNLIKNSQINIAKKIRPIITFDKSLFPKRYVDDTFDVPRVKNESTKEIPAMIIGEKLESQATNTAVKPKEPQVLGSIEWLMADE